MRYTTRARSLLIAALLAAAAAAPAVATAATWMLPNGVFVGNVCRSGAYFWVYPPSSAQPVGSPGSFWMGSINFNGFVSAE